MSATVPQRPGRRNTNIAGDNEIHSYIHQCIENAEGQNVNEVWNQIQSATDVRNEVQEVLSMLKTRAGGEDSAADAEQDLEMIALKQELQMLRNNQ